MQKNQQFCYKHPSALTFRKCYSCQRPICSECQITKSHHIFCSQSCWRNFLLVGMLAPIKRFYQSAKYLQNPWGGVAIILIFVIWQINTNQKLKRDIQNIQTKRISLTGGENEYLDAHHKLKITSPAETNGMVYRKNISIEGEAEDNSIVMLMDGDKLIQVAKAENGIFLLDNVKLTRAQKTLSLQMMSLDGERLALETIEFKYNTPTSRYLSQTLSRGDKKSPNIALTFDGGSINNMSEEILNSLREYHVKATFFLTGKFIQNYPQTVLRITADGHEVGNHTFHHPHLTSYEKNRKHQTLSNVTKEYFQKELKETEILFNQLTGRKLAPFWRAPYGEHNSEIRKWAAELGYKHVSWTEVLGEGKSMDTMDWVSDPSNPNYDTAEQIYMKILNFADSTQFGANGSIILMHLGSERKDDYPQKKLPDIISGLKDRGYQLTTVSKLAPI